MLDKNIFLLWLQGWDKATWLNNQVAESWKINNPEWKIHLMDLANLKDYVTDIDYIYDTTKNITPQAKSDIIRLSLLKKYGGVWADATLLCMQPLEHWVHEAVEPASLWMYHSSLKGIKKKIIPACWFIVSKKEEYIITKWKEDCDKYWSINNFAKNYLWLDCLFAKLYFKDVKFRELWLKVPFLYCELDGQSHTLSHHGMKNNSPHIKYLFKTQPPYALKFWNYWNDIFPNINTKKCINSNGFCAIQLSKRRYCFKHDMK